MLPSGLSNYIRVAKAPILDNAGIALFGVDLISVSTPEVDFGVNRLKEIGFAKSILILMRCRDDINSKDKEYTSG